MRPIEDKVKKLLGRKKPTGEELGKILLIDLANAQTSKPSLNHEELLYLQDCITTPEDWHVFRQYAAIKRYIIAFSLDHDAQLKALNSNFLNFTSRKQLLQLSEASYLNLVRQPFIMTRQQYNERLEATKQEKDIPENTIVLENGQLTKGIAILEGDESHYIETGQIKNNKYVYSLLPAIKENMAESFLQNTEMTNTIKELKQVLKQNFKRLSGFNYAIDSFKKITGIKQLEVFKKEIPVKLLHELNNTDNFNYILRYGLTENERPEKELRSEAAKLFDVDFTEKDIVIKAAEKARVRQIIAENQDQSEAVRLVGNYLTGLKP